MDAGGPEQSPQALPEALAKRTRNRVCFRFKKICLCNVARCTAPARHAAPCLPASPFTQRRLQYGGAPRLATRWCSDPGWCRGFRLPLFLFSVLLHKTTHGHCNYSPMASRCSTGRVHRRLWPCCMSIWAHGVFQDHGRASTLPRF